jgi:hypothetical protein
MKRACHVGRFFPSANTHHLSYLDVSLFNPGVQPHRTCERLVQWLTPHDQKGPHDESILSLTQGTQYAKWRQVWANCLIQRSVRILSLETSLSVHKFLCLRDNQIAISSWPLHLNMWSMYRPGLWESGFLLTHPLQDYISEEGMIIRDRHVTAMLWVCTQCYETGTNPLTLHPGSRSDRCSCLPASDEADRLSSWKTFQSLMGCDCDSNKRNIWIRINNIMLSQHTQVTTLHDCDFF